MLTLTVNTGHSEQPPATDLVTVHVGNSGCGYLNLDPPINQG
jgi:hypothetical protein